MDGTHVTHFQVGRMLGRGGMGEVYEAVDLDLDRRVALKFIAPELAADADNLQRFEREARSAAALNHPHIATLYSFERDGARRFIAMELVEGESLRDRMRPGPLPIGEALAIARDVAAALAAAHRRGIVHRDIKPENLMFGEEGRVKVMDFGLARAALASRITLTGSTLGTAGYMSPESIRGSAGPPTDVFALGVVLYEMLAGRLPFAGDNPMALMFTIANEPPLPLREARPDVPDAVQSVVARLLEKDPEKRMTAADAARELAGMTGASLPALVSDTEEVEALPRGAEDGEMLPVPIPSPDRRPRWMWARIGAAAVIVPVTLWFVILRPKTVKQDHEQAVRFNNIGHAALRRNDWTGAADTLQLALRADPHYREAMVNLATAYRELHRDDSADSLLLLALAGGPKDPALVASAEYNLGASNLRAGAYPSAISHLETSISIDSTSFPDPYIALGTALVKARRTDEARIAAQRGLTHFPNEPRLLRTMGLVELESRHPDRALNYLDGALVEQPSLAMLRGLRAEALARLGRMREARAEWEAYTGGELDPAEREEMSDRVRALGLSQ
jgi:tRNA A-37 threonylcarbamoyl transferase component Bud32/tetratricopeptide (TPR) repeat protein